MSPHIAGWVDVCSVTLAKGIQHVLRGELVAASHNVATILAAINPAPVTLGWAGPDVVGRFLRHSASGADSTVAQVHDDSASLARYQLLGTLLLGPGFSELDPAPDWIRVLLLHAQVMDGALAPELAAERVDGLLDIGMPGPLALRDHIRALVAQDADELLKLGRELAAMGYLDAARNAATQARALFVAHRASAKARLADVELRIIDDVLAGRVRSSDMTVTHDSVKLTRREYEVCNLVAEGLTNVKISQRIFVSVRTVESHVLSARILELRRQGLLAPQA